VLMLSCSIEKLSVFAICLGLVCIGEIPFLGLVLLLIGCVRVRALFSLRLWKNLAWIPMEPATTLMMFWVSVLILSVQAAEAFAIEGQISLGAAADNTEVVVQGLPNDVI